MDMRQLRVVLCGSACILSAMLEAAVVAPRAVQRLTEDADAIIVGKGTIAYSSGAIGSRIEVDVIRVLKGDAVGLVAVSVSGVRGSGRSLDPVATSGVDTGGIGIWFLKRTGQVLSLLPTSDGDETAIAYPAVGELSEGEKYPVGASVVEKIVLEVAAVASSGREGAGGFLVEASYGLDTPVVTETFEKLTRSSHAEARLAGYSGLIMRNQPAALTGFEAELASVGRTGPLADSVVLRDLIIIGIEDEYRSLDPAGIEVLGRLARSVAGWSRLPEAASFALRAIHTRDTLPILMSLLESPSRSVRYNAVFGIASFANGLPIASRANVRNMGYLDTSASSSLRTEDTLTNIPSLASYEENESHYVTYWRNWVQAHASEIMP